MILRRSLFGKLKNYSSRVMLRTMVALLISTLLLPSLPDSFTPTVDAAAQGPLSATSSGNCVDDASIGTSTWANPGNVQAGDGANATASVDATVSHYIKCTGFGFTIPTGSTINGITVGVKRNADSTGNGGSSDAAMRVLKNGVIGTTDRSTTTVYTTTSTYEDHGSTNDLWGNTWTVSDINATNFGTAFAATKAASAGAAHTVSVDHIRVTVYYTAPPAQLTQASYRFFGNQDITSGADYTFATAFGTSGTYTEVGYDVATTTDGGYVAVGTSDGVYGGINQMIAVKYDANGNIEWQKVIGDSTNAMYARAVSSMSDGGYIIAGYGYSPASALLIKLDHYGAISWIKRNQSQFNSYFYDIATSSDGSFATVGYDGGGNYDITTTKYDSSGDVIWSKGYGNTSIQEGYALSSTSDGGYIATGTETSAGNSSADILVVKYSSSGVQQWARSWAGGGRDVPRAITQASDGSYLLAAYSVSFSAVNQDDMIVIKLDSSGNLVWNKDWDLENGYDYAYGVDELSNGDYVVAGYGLSSSSGYESIVLRFNTSGTLATSKKWGGAASDGLYGVTATSDGGYVTAGLTRNYGASSGAFQLLKYNSSNTINNCTQCGSVTGTLTSPSATYTDPGFSSIDYTYNWMTPSLTSASFDNSVVVTSSSVVTSIDVGTASNGQNQAITSSGDATPFRLRANFAVANGPATAANLSLKLQYAARGADNTCDTSFTNETYADVTDTTPIKYYGNTNAKNGLYLATNANDPTDGGNTLIRQHYLGAGAAVFSNSSAIAVGQDGMWDFALATNSAPAATTYCLRVVKGSGSTLSAYNVIPQVSTPGGNTAPNAPTSLAQKTTGDVAIATGGWTNTSSVKFTATSTDTDATDTLKLCVEKKPIGTSFSNSEDLCGTAVSYTGSAVAPTVTITGITDATQYHWQARIKDTAGDYSSWVAFGGNAETSADFGVDTTAPTGGTVYDGSTNGVDQTFNTGTLNSLSANWTGVSVDVSGLDHYDYSIGTAAGNTDVKPWTSSGTATTMTASDLTLKTSEKYYVNVRTTDNAGNVSTTISSNGILVPPSMSFTVSPASLSFNSLKPSNSYNDTQSSSFTTSTNAYGGYVIRSRANDVLRSSSNSTIAMFSGGTYASPTAWGVSDRGFGYVSNDSLIQGVSNKFGTSGCIAVSFPSTCLFAPFAQSQTGDIVADHLAGVVGNEIVNESFNLTYRISTQADQAANTYSTTLIHTAVPVY